MTQRPAADRYVVEGRGPFPLDMMRRDRSEPAGDEDRTAVDATYEAGLAPRELRRVSLVTRERTTLDDRWESFGWRVVRPLRPWNPLSGYTGEEPTEDVPARDARRVVTMTVICGNDQTAMQVEGLMRAAVSGRQDVEVEPSSIERLGIHLDRMASERPRLPEATVR